MKDMTKRNMTEATNIRHRLEAWYERTNRTSAAHYEMSGRLQKIFNIMGVVSGVCGIAAGGTGLSTMGEVNMQEWQVASAIAGFLAGSIGSTMAFLKYAEKAEAHRVSGAAYSSLKREIEVKLSFPETVDESYLREFTRRWDKLNEECPTVPPKIWKRLRKKSFGSHSNGVEK